jgi:hypothetical protein
MEERQAQAQRGLLIGVGDEEALEGGGAAGFEGCQGSLHQPSERLAAPWVSVGGHGGSWRSELKILIRDQRTALRRAAGRSDRLDRPRRNRHARS